VVVERASRSSAATRASEEEGSVEEVEEEERVEEEEEEANAFSPSSALFFFAVFSFSLLLEGQRAPEATAASVAPTKSCEERVRREREGEEGVMMSINTIDQLLSQPFCVCFFHGAQRLSAGLRASRRESSSLEDIK
jgi:hypothetical protein